MKGFFAAENAVFAPAEQATPPSHDGATPLSPEELKRRTAYSREIAANFGQIISLMMRARNYRFTMLTELEWLVMPALITRQLKVAEGVLADRGAVAPVAAVMWAHVSTEIDKRITENVDQPIKLRPEEWRSGDITWIVEAIGDNTAVSGLLQNLKQNELKDKTVRMRVRNKDGKATIGRLELQEEPPKRT